MQTWRVDKAKIIFYDHRGKKILEGILRTFMQFIFFINLYCLTKRRRNKKKIQNLRLLAASPCGQDSLGINASFVKSNS